MQGNSPDSMMAHKRNEPLLADEDQGYADRKDAHLHQDMQYHSGLFADDSDDDGPLGSRISPRYQNKSSYIERNKEKRGSLSLAEKKVSHYLATGSLGRPIPMEASFGYSGGESSNAGAVTDINRSASSSGQRKDRSGSQGERVHNSHPGTRTPSQSSSAHHHHSAEHTSRVNQHSTPGDYNSHPEKDTRTSSSSAANNGKQSSSTGKDKEQVQKSAIRVCGDWSEHISSSGKRYYYNCKTEVSQWEKPKEWNSELCRTPDHRSKDGRPRVLSQSHANKISSDSRASRHSSSSEHQQHEFARSHRVGSGDSASESHLGRDTASSNAHQHYRDSRDSNQYLSRDSSRDSNSRDIHKSSVERTRSGDSTSSNSHHYHHHQGTPLRSGSTPGGNNGLSDSQHLDYKRSQHEGQYSSHGDYKRSSSETPRRRRDSQGSQRYHDTGQGPVDDMDISPSPSPSPSSSRPSSATGTPQLPPSSTPIATSTTPHNPVSTPGGGHRSSSPLGNPIPTLVNRQTVTEGAYYDKTIQTLQELQKALSMHIHRAQQSTTSTRPPLMQQPPNRHTPVPMSSHQATPSQHLIYPAGQGPTLVSGLPVGVAPHHQPYPGLQAQGPQPTVVPTTQPEEGLADRTSPVSATSSRSSCGSPTPSDSSSQNAAIASQALTAAAMKREETAKLTASLSNYYNEKLIGHVIGWQADLVEKQAAKLWEESMVNGSLQCSQISVELKKARSQVRIAEIQSTLHEQRIMSSDQQRQEIENLKTPSSFLPS